MNFAINSGYLTGEQYSTIKGALGNSFAQGISGSIFENEPDEINLVSHRGYSELAPENTISAFELAAKNGYDTIECDVSWTKDGVPVILHDETINRTARKQNGKKLFWPKKCSKMTYDELLKYDFGSWHGDKFKGEKIPTFSETLECADKNNLNLYIELKEAKNFDEAKAKQLVDEIKQKGLEDKVTWISFNEDYLKLIGDLMPETRLGYLSKKEVSKNTLNSLYELNKGDDEVFLDIKSSKMTKEGAKLLEDAGFEFEAWTVNNEDEFEDLKNLGCIGVTTNELTAEDLN